MAIFQGSIQRAPLWPARAGVASERPRRRAARLGLLILLAVVMAWGSYTLIPQPNHESLFPREGLPGLRVRSLGISAILSAMLLRYLYPHHLWR